MIYDVRLREILVHEFQVESEDLRSAFLIALKKAHNKKLKDQPVGRFFEIETLYKGIRNVSTDRKKYIPRKKPTMPKRKIAKTV